VTTKLARPKSNNVGFQLSVVPHMYVLHEQQTSAACQANQRRLWFLADPTNGRARLCYSVVSVRLSSVYNVYIVVKPGLPWIWIYPWINPWIYPWIYPCVDIRLKLHCGYSHGYFSVICPIELSHILISRHGESMNESINFYVA